MNFIAVYLRYIILLPLFLVMGCANLADDTTDPQQFNQAPSYSFPTQQQATGKNVFVFDPNHHMWGAYDKNGSLVRQGRGSGGQSFCQDIGRACKTPSGTYQVFRKGGSDCKSTKYPIPKGGAPMPYCMFFTGGYAIHGSNHVPNYNASHGCIRVYPSDAAWLSHYFINNGTTVVVRPY